MNVKANCVRMKKEDNVATALTNMKKGTDAVFIANGRTEGITVAEDIPLGHKVALKAIEKGMDVTKYGETIGIATVKIEKGMP